MGFSEIKKFFNQDVDGLFDENKSLREFLMKERQWQVMQKNRIGVFFSQSKSDEEIKTLVDLRE